MSSDLPVQPVERLINLLAPEKNLIFNMAVEQAVDLVGTGDPDKVRTIDGQFALIHRNGRIVRMARSIGRPLRYFLAKQANGPVLIVAERIDQIRKQLEEDGLLDQFHPSYTRMVPAHYVTEISLVGCPDPNPVYTRFLQSHRDALPTDIDQIGSAYISALQNEVDQFIATLPTDVPIGVLFSGGIDSGAVLLCAYNSLRKSGSSPSRLKAFTLAVDGRGSDFQQASDFLKSLDLDMFLEVLEVDSSSMDFAEAVRVIEDYKPLDVQSAVMGLAACKAIRQRYPDWKYLLDGDGGDENLRDYPIEENSELTIRSVLNNPFFYHEGWGVDKIKHSLTFSGGQSRGHVRTFAPADFCGFIGFSPFATPNVIDVAEGIPFIELTEWDHQKLYDLKGQVVKAGIQQVMGLDMPIFEKNRFQRGAAQSDTFDKLFPDNERAYRNAFADHFEVSAR